MMLYTPGDPTRLHMWGIMGSEAFKMVAKCDP